MLQLKSFSLKQKVIQSPMAGCTDLAFRLLAREYGMEFAFLEMISAHALVQQNHKTMELIKSTVADKPLGAQLVGCDAEVMGEAAAIIEDMGFDLLDLNLGCPVPKIVSPGGGSALLKEPEKAKNIFDAVIKKVKKIPVTVKTRLGFTDPSGKEAVQIARLAEDAGLSAVTIHGRTREQGYSGTADWHAIGRVKEAVQIPVIGNGDVTSGDDAKRMLEITGCDGVMIGRGSLGNPWIYQSIEAAINGKDYSFKPSLEDMKRAALKHIDFEMQFEGEKITLLRSRRIACWYFKAMPGAADFRNAINHTQTVAEVRELITHFGDEPSSAGIDS